MAANPFQDGDFIELFSKCAALAVDALEKVGKKDLFRAARPQGEGSFSCLLFTDYGVQSWIAAERFFSHSVEMRALDEMISNSADLTQLDCSETFVSRRLGARDWVLAYVAADFDLVGCGKEEVAKRALRFCEQVGEAFERGIVKITAVTLIASLRLPQGIEQIDLPDGGRVRRLQPDEIERLSRQDASMEGGLSIQELSHAVALEYELECPIALVEEERLDGRYPSIHLDQRHRVERFLDALSIVLPHRCEAMQTSWEIGIKGLPVTLGRQSRLGVLALGLTDVGERQVEQIVATYALVPMLKTGHLGVASSRLTSAERRLERSDQLLDAVIGLEALLAPRDSGELTFRLALNYALLDEAGERRERYDKMASVLEVRNMLVHGATMSSSKQQARLSDAAHLACALLRDALQTVCKFSRENGVPTLDKEYWLTRLLGPKTGSVLSSPP